MNLDAFAAAAREGSTWNDERAARVLVRTLRARDDRAARSRTTRRALALGAGAVAVVLLLLRGTPPVDAPAAVAQLETDDAGYGRD